MSQYVMHRDARYFSDPDAFIPERWLDADFQPSRFVYFPFSAGPSAMEAIFAGSIDLTYVGPNPALNAYIRSRGEEIRVLAGATLGGGSS